MFMFLFLALQMPSQREVSFKGIIEGKSLGWSCGQFFRMVSMMSLMVVYIDMSYVIHQRSLSLSFWFCGFDCGSMVALVVVTVVFCVHSSGFEYS